MSNQEKIPGWAFCILRAIPHYKSLDLWVYRWIYRLSLELWVIVGFMRNNIKNTQNRPLCQKNALMVKKILYSFYYQSVDFRIIGDIILAVPNGGLAQLVRAHASHA